MKGTLDEWETKCYGSIEELNWQNCELEVKSKDLEKANVLGGRDEKYVGEGAEEHCRNASRFETPSIRVSRRRG